LKRVTVKLDDDKHLKLKVIAASQQLSLNEILVRAAEMYIQQHSKDIIDV
jgi:predicted HicB family RNase H-like nuclease